MQHSNKLISLKKDFKYVVNEEIYYSEHNQTGFYKAKEVGTERYVGIKRVGISPSSRRLAESEIIVLMGLEEYTRAIPTVYCYSIDGNMLTIVMEFIKGDTLALCMEKEKNILEKPETVRKNFQRLRALAEILGDVHRKRVGEGYVQHKDLKPQNIIVQNKNGRESLRLIDFGISAGCAVRGSGSLGYQAPEQSTMFSGVVDLNRIDVFAFGLIMYELLCGKKLVFGHDLVLDVKSGKWKNIPEITNPNVPKEANDILKKCLAYNPKERPENGGKIEWMIRKIISRS